MSESVTISALNNLCNELMTVRSKIDEIKKIEKEIAGKKHNFDFKITLNVSQIGVLVRITAGMLDNIIIKSDKAENLEKLKNDIINSIQMTKNKKELFDTNRYYPYRDIALLLVQKRTKVMECMQNQKYIKRNCSLLL